MNSFLNPHNGTSFTGVVDILAHFISLFQENESPKNLKGIFIPKSDITVGFRNFIADFWAETLA